MTARGIVYHGLCVLTAAAGYILARRELTVVVAALLAVSLCLWLSLLLAAHTLQDNSTWRERAVPRGGQASLRLRLRGICLLPVQVIWKVGIPAGGENSVYHCVCGIGRGRELGLQAVFCPHMGAVTYTSQAQLRDACGLFRRRLRPCPPQEVSVWPVSRRLVPPLPENGEQERNASVQSGDSGNTFTEARLYREGDSLRQIHWKLSMRSQELFTRQYEQESRRRVLLWIDPLMPEQHAEAYRDTVGEAAASFGRFLLYHDTEVLLAVGGMMLADIPEGTEPDGLYQAISALEKAAAKTDGEELPPEAGSLPVIAFGGCRSHYEAYVRKLCAGELLPVTVMQRQAEDTGNLWHWPGGSAAPYSVEGGERH